MLHRSQVYRFHPSLDLRSVRAISQHLGRNSYLPQIHYNVFDNTVLVAATTQEVS